ncbi:MAG: YIP1 family protein [Treponema sp.]|nr:YIP1 family protein [Treponema sp.]
MKKFFISFLILISVFTSWLFASAPEAAPVPWLSYNYGVWDTSIPAPAAYEVQKFITASDYGIGDFLNPMDMSTDADGNIYVLDSGNKRIVVFDSDLNLLRLIDLQKDNQQIKDCRGMYLADNGKIYVCDRGNKRVLVFDNDGNYLRSIIKPVTDLIDEQTEFIPDKVLVDHLGVIYVLSMGCYEGAYTFDENGDFLGFFGSNKVNVTSKLRSDRIWRKFTTKEQRDRMYRYVPVEYVNFDIDSEGFIYTVSNYGDNYQKGQIRKLNPLSQNILFKGKKPELAFFGDLENTYTNRVEKTNLVAVDVDKDNFISCLDSERGRIFVYDQSCNLLTIFGGTGNQEGSFKNPVDIVSSNGKLFVLDNVRNSITCFKTTRFGAALIEATNLYEQGYFEDALEPWFEALKMDRNNFIVLRGIGRAYERLKEYDKAMDYYKQAEYHAAYSDSFHEYRTAFLRKYFVGLMLILLAILLAIFVLPPLKAKYGKKKEIQHVYEISKWYYPFYLVLHPFKGWEEFKLEHKTKGSVMIANIIMLLWLIAEVFEYQCKGFIFNKNRLDNMNIFILMASTWGLAILWSVTNWALCTLQDGKGTFREIWINFAYTRMTYLITIIPVIIISNVITADEAFFMNIIVAFVQIWGLVQLLLATKSAHQYTMNKTVGSMLLTLLGAFLVILIGMLFVSLFAQLWSFIATIAQEIMMRM